MADSRVRLRKTNPEVLIGNLRGEVGEAITNWIILRQLIGSAKHLQTDDVLVDMKNESLAFINAVRDRISNDLVLTLAELSEQKIGQTTFYFASEKAEVGNESQRLQRSRSEPRDARFRLKCRLQ